MVRDKWNNIFSMAIYLAALAVLPVSYLNTTLRKSYIKSAPLRPWFIGVSLHVLKTTTLFGKFNNVVEW